MFKNLTDEALLALIDAAAKAIVATPEMEIPAKGLVDTFCDAVAEKIGRGI